MLGALAVAQSVRAQDVAPKLSSGPSPYAVGPWQQATAGMEANPTDPQDYDSAEVSIDYSGASYQWSLGAVMASADDLEDWGNVDPSGYKDSLSNSTSESCTVNFSAAGGAYYEVDCSVSATWTGYGTEYDPNTGDIVDEWTFDVGASGDAWAQPFIVVTVTFAQNPITTGVCTDHSASGTIVNSSATVAPVEAVGDVQITAGSEVSVSSVLPSDNPPGMITFTVAGVNGSTSQTGDPEQLKATLDGTEIASASAIVIKPTSVEPYNDYPDIDGEVYSSAVQNPSPVITPPGWYIIWIDWMDVTVLDQWNQPLPAIFNGASVSEQGGPGGFSGNINQTVQDGSYSDPVGCFIPNAYASQSAAQNALPTAAADFGSGSSDQNMAVLIGGVSLQGGLGGRDVNWNPDANNPSVMDFSIDW
jgi:hypothetical protein